MFLWFINIILCEKKLMSMAIYFLYVYKSVFHPIYQSMYLWINLSINLFIYLSIYLSIHLSRYLFNNLTFLKFHEHIANSSNILNFAPSSYVLPSNKSLYGAELCRHSKSLITFTVVVSLQLYIYASRHVNVSVCLFVCQCIYNFVYVFVGVFVCIIVCICANNYKNLSPNRYISEQIFIQTHIQESIKT